MDVSGGLRREVHVDLLPERMLAFGMGVGDVLNALSNNNKDRVHELAVGEVLVGSSLRPELPPRREGPARGDGPVRRLPQPRSGTRGRT